MPTLPTAVFDGSFFEVENISNRDNSLAFSSSSVTMETLGNHIRIHEPRDLASDKNATIAMMAHQRYVIQVVASTMSTISLLSALMAVYWFCMMRRNFRRDLVLLLILAGSWRSLWFLIQSGSTFMHGGMISTESPFCQASGYLLLVGFQGCDLAILFMSMHMCLQIFPHTRGPFGHDGLYPVRRWVIALWILVPNLSAGLAFVGDHGGYVGQGAFCFLPIRPFWYRLALYWVPRYLIWCYVTYVAIRIYRHVGAEFRVFGQERDRSSSVGMPAQSSVDRARQREETKRRASQGTRSAEKSAIDDDEGYAPDDISVLTKTRPAVERTVSLPDSAKERIGTLSWSAPGYGPDTTQVTPTNRSMPGSRRGSKQLAPGIFSEDFAPVSASDSGRRRPSNVSLTSALSVARVSLADNVLSPINEGLPSNSAPARSEPDQRTATMTLELRRRAIQRQLRLLFIYPCTYLIFWIIPFVFHCLNYTEYFAHHPIFGLNVAQVFCLCIMTFVDVTVFCWRERPWRHIPGSDGTFWGSLAWWRYVFDGEWTRVRKEVRTPSFPKDEKGAEPLKDNNASNTGLLASLKRWSMSLTGGSPRGSESSGTGQAMQRQSTSHKRNYSGGSDRKHMEADRAHERLMLERAEYEQNRRSLQERRQSALSEQKRQAGDARKEWFDRDLESEDIAPR